MGLSLHLSVYIMLGLPSKQASLGPEWGPCGQPTVGPDTGVKCGARVGPTLRDPGGAPVGQPKSVG